MNLRTTISGLFVACLTLAIGLAVSGDAAAGTATNLKCNGCVGSKDIGTGAVQTKHIRKNAVTSAKIKNGTIKTEDLATSAQVGTVRQILSGGFNQGPSFADGYIAPGWTTLTLADYPDTGEGKSAVQIRVPAGTLSKLRVNVHTATAASGGSLTLTVMINGVDTALTCSVTAEGDCTSNASVAVNDDDRLGLHVVTDLANEGNWTLTYTIQFS